MLETLSLLPIPIVTSIKPTTPPNPLLTTPLFPKDLEEINLVDIKFIVVYKESERKTVVDGDQL